MFSHSLGDASQMRLETKWHKGQTQERTQASVLPYLFVKDLETAIKQCVSSETS